MFSSHYSRDPFSSLFPRLNYRSRLMGFEDILEEMEREFNRDPLFNDRDIGQAEPMWPRLGVPLIEPDKTAKRQRIEKGDAKGPLQALTTTGDQGQALVAADQSPGWMSAYARAPAIDIIERDNEFVVNVDVPGVRKEDLKLQVQEDSRGRKVLTVSGERKGEDNREDKAAGWRSSQRMYGRFSRSLRLPDNCKVDHVAAKQENGVLAITLPKTAAMPVKQSQDIQIK